MMKNKQVLFAFVYSLIVCLGLHNGVAAIPDGKKVVGYFPDYRIEELTSVNFGNVTHVIYFGMDADLSGNLMASASFTSSMPAVVAKVHGAGKKVSVCVGGWLSDGYFSAIANSTTARANFINQLVSFCRNNNMDGVDLDWEPVAESDVVAYSTMIKELDAALAPYGMLLSVAVNASRYEILASAADSLDWVSIMAYDMNYAHADHSTYADSVDAMTFWTQSGIPPAKLLMGVPFFGLDEGWVSALSYAEIVDLYNPAPNINNVSGYGFNGIELIKAKTAYALSMGFGGMMIWELGQDKFDSRSLLSALATAMGQEVVPVPVLPAPWLTADIGPVGTFGGASQSNGVFTVTGAGAGIGGRADAFRFVYQTLSGDGEIRARVSSQVAYSSAAKAGVMIRESLNANSRFAFMDLTMANTFGYLYRNKTGQRTTTISGGTAQVAPNNWVRLVRAGNTLTAYKSSDGITWTKVSSASLSMASTIYIGMAVTSQDSTRLNTAIFDKILVVP